MIEDLSAYVDFLVKYHITPKQFLLPYCLHLDRIRENEGTDKRLYAQRAGKNRPMANLYKYSSEIESWKIEEVQDLIDKGLIEGSFSFDRGEKVFYPDLMKATSKFIQEVFLTMEDHEEFYFEYPPFVANFENPLSGPKIPLRLVSLEAIGEIYERVVKNKIIHHRIMRALKWGKENGQINMRIDKFLETRHWISLEQLMEEGGGGTSPEVRGTVV